MTTVLLALALISGGTASAGNTANIQEDLDTEGCDRIDNYPTFREVLEEICDDAEQLRTSQAASAVSPIIRLLAM